ncbi:A-kinase anchor protein 10 [Aphelenchoides avenae]|nr:A-kinase anchor protein 10 [Aphelenchus avenae]
MSKLNGLIGKLRAKKGSSAGLQHADSSYATEGPSAATDDYVLACVEYLTLPTHDELLKSGAMASSLDEVLRDASALSHFIHFMDAAGRSHLVKFWLHIQGFKASVPSYSGIDAEQRSVIKKDAENIYAQYLSNDAQYSTGVPEALKRVTLDRLKSHQTVDAHMFKEIEDYVYRNLNERFFPDFQRSINFLRHQVDVLQTKQVRLGDILQTHRLLSAFIEFMEAMNKRSLLEFVLTVESFAGEMDNRDPDAVQEEAMVIYDRYLSMQATDPLHFDDAVRINVEQKICTEDGRTRADCFEEPQLIAAYVLQEKFLPKFMDSQLYQNVMNDLLLLGEQYWEARFRSEGQERPKLRGRCHSDVNMTGPLEEPHQRNNRTRSNTASLVDDETASQCSSTSNGTVKTTSKRRTMHSSLAKIDRYGRYTPLFDSSLCTMEYDQSAKVRIRSTLEKYLNQSAKKERLVADEMAQLIIADIQNLVEMGNSRRSAQS